MSKVSFRDRWRHQMDEFSEKFQTASHFRKIILRISRQKCVCSLWRDCCVLYDPISHEMHVVQQFNMVLPLNWLKTYPKETLLYHFHAEKALFKGPKSATSIFGLKMTPAPSLELFRKFIRLVAYRTLVMEDFKLRASR